MPSGGGHALERARRGVRVARDAFGVSSRWARSPPSSRPIPPCAPIDREILVTISPAAGNAPFLAYGVVNDGARPGEGTGDGAVVSMRRLPPP